MLSFGFDIGTSKICVVAINQDKQLLDYVSKVNFFDNAKVQSADRILNTCLSLKSELESKVGQADFIGISNQMHGILYVDKFCNAVSPLYTWQDEKGNLSYRSSTYCEYLFEKTGYNVPSGYGLVTHFYLKSNGLVPSKAYKICTIGDYVAQKLSSQKLSMHPSNAASIGFYNVLNDCFDYNALEKVGIAPDIIPEISYEAQKITAIGDNQASFIGSVEDYKNSVLVNVGSGSQVSVVTTDYKDCAKTSDYEIRPFDAQNKLIVGAAICGGYAYTALGNFFLSVADMFGFTPDKHIFDYMDCVIKENTELDFDTSFKGSRKNPFKRASVTNISEDCFTAGDFVAACQKGIVKELYNLYLSFNQNRGVVVGAGNGLRRNVYLQKLVREYFGVKPVFSVALEEAAFGAAINAAKLR